MDTKRRRTQRLIDPRWQLGMACAVTLLMLGAGGVYLLGSELLTSQRVEAALGSRGRAAAILAADVFFFAAVAVVVHQIIVRLTHSVVGPALVLERGLRAMARGDHGVRLALRDGDYLTTVADAASDLQVHLSGQRETVARIVHELRGAAGDERAVLSAIDELDEEFDLAEDGGRVTEPQGDPGSGSGEVGEAASRAA